MEYKHISMYINPLLSPLRFDHQLPLYNWPFPFDLGGQKIDDSLSALTQIEPHTGKHVLCHVLYIEDGTFSPRKRTIAPAVAAN